MEKLRNYGLLAKYVLVTQWRKIRGTAPQQQESAGDHDAQ